MLEKVWRLGCYAGFLFCREAEGMLATDAIAELFWQIHAQPRSAWTFEADLRPWAEKF
jgi:hypothetical protein